MKRSKWIVTASLLLAAWGGGMLLLDFDKRYVQVLSFFYLLALLCFFLWLVIVLAARARGALKEQKQEAENNLRELKQAAHEAKK